MVKFLMILALTSVARMAGAACVDEGARRLAVETGEDACEGKGLAKNECKSLGCAWGGGECWSADGDKQRELMDKKKKKKKAVSLYRSATMRARSKARASALARRKRADLEVVKMR